MKISKTRSLAFMLMILISQTGFTQVNSRQLINAICDSLQRHYIFPEQAIRISAYLQSKENTKAYQVLKDDPLKLAVQIMVDLKAVQQDPHLRIQFEPAFIPQNSIAPDSEQMKRVKAYWKENNYAFKKLEILPGNIGYLLFTQFVDDIGAAKSTVSAAMRFLSRTQALILDLRENLGGNPQMVSLIESYFFRDKTHMNDLINRSNDDTTVMYADPSKADSVYMNMPLYILTSKHTFSGAEDFSYAMQAAKRAVIVGETTGGGAHPQMPFTVGQGFVLSIPFARSLNPITKSDWEGTGVIPDTKTEAASALLKAEESIFTNGKENAKTEKEKNKYQYYIQSLLNNTSTPSGQLMPFTGEYGDLLIYFKNNRLYCKNNNNNSVSLLQQLTKNLFILDSEAQIEFIKDSHAKYTIIKIYVNDGSVFEEKRKLK
jgi:hypothetical protein